MPWYFYVKNGAPKTPPVVTSVPIGQVFLWPAVMPFSYGSELQAKAAPSGYLFCNGAEVLISEFPDLYTTIDNGGDIFGAPSDGLHFVLPNFMDQLFATQNFSDINFDTVGKTGGTTTHSHTLTSHSHDVAHHVHSFADHIHTLAAHTHDTYEHSHHLPGSTGNAAADTFQATHSAPDTSAIASHVHAHGGQTNGKKAFSSTPSITNSGNNNPLSLSTTSTATVAASTSSGDTLVATTNQNLPPVIVVNAIIYSGV